MRIVHISILSTLFLILTSGFGICQTPLFSDTLICDQRRFVINKYSNHITIEGANCETILLENYRPAGMEFEDFNQDGYTDIVFALLGNITVHDLFLYDQNSRCFVKVEGFRNYPEPKNLTGTGYYYSYHRSGCADMNWDSDLFIIKGGKVFKLGNIQGRQCTANNNTPSISTYKVCSDDLTPIDHIEMKEFEEFEDKWGFIDEYWLKNFKKFIK